MRMSPVALLCFVTFWINAGLCAASIATFASRGFPYVEPARGPEDLTIVGIFMIVVTGLSALAIYLAARNLNANAYRRVRKGDWM